MLNLSSMLEVTEYLLEVAAYLLEVTEYLLEVTEHSPSTLFCKGISW